MGDLFDIGKAGISAYKSALATTGQNIANVDTEGYNRRETKIEELSSSSADILSISNSSGLGVRMGEITRAFDQFLDIKLQSSTSSYSFAKSKSEIFDQLESTLIPKNATVGTRLREFFDGLSNLAQDPDNANLRRLALSGANAVSASISELHGGLSDLRTVTHGTLKLTVADFNSTLKNLSHVQNEILGNSVKSGSPHGLLDRRDTLLEQLSEIADISVDYKANGSITVSLGKLGAVGTLLEGATFSEVTVQSDMNGVKTFVKDNFGVSSSVHFSSGQMAGLISADISTGETIADLNQLAQKFVTEMNSLHHMGLDKDGERGGKFFGLETASIIKSPKNLGTASMRIEGYANELSGSTLNVAFDGDSATWKLSTQDQNISSEFESNLELMGLSLMIEGKPQNGDSFSVEISDASAADMRVLITDERKLASAGLHVVEADIANIGDAELDLSYFEAPNDSNITDLKKLFLHERNAANPIAFTSAGVLGVIENVGALEDFSMLDEQSKLTFFSTISDLSASDNLALTLGGANFQFALSSVFSDLGSMSELAAVLNDGDLRSAGTLKSFNDLGLHAVASGSSLLISSAYQPGSTYSELQSGSLAATAGVLNAADAGDASLNVFTREGIQISGKTLSEADVRELITVENGFSADAVYRASHIPTATSESFAGTSVNRRTTDGLEYVAISAAGLDDGNNNNVAILAAGAFPTTRTSLNAPITVQTQSGRSATVTIPNSMMAGQIAEQLSKELDALGMGAVATNKVELSNIPNGLIAFDLIGKNLEAKAISVTVANLSPTNLVNEINKFTNETGITAYMSTGSGIVLDQADAADIILKNMSLAGGALSVNQLDQFGERLLTASKTLSDTEHLIVGGNVQFKSTEDFSVVCNGVTGNSVNSKFEMGFATKTFNLEKNTTDLSFYTNSDLDTNASNSVTGNAVASNSSYSLTLSDGTSSLVGSVKPQISTDFTSAAVSASIVKDLRGQATSTVFYGDAFALASGFPSEGSTIGFTIGDQKYVATLDIAHDIKVEGTEVKVGTETLTGVAALAKLVSGSRFSVTGPESDRISVNFEAATTGGGQPGIRLSAVANDGVISGHGITFASSNLGQVKTDFHISNTSQTEIYSKYFSQANATNANIGSVLIGATEYVIDFDTATDAVASTPALPAFLTVATVANPADNTQYRIKVTATDQSPSKDIRIKASASSASFGVSTSSAQVSVTTDGLQLINIGNNKVKSAVTISSLASEVLSISGAGGEDLIFTSAGTRQPIILGKAIEDILETPREYSVKINSDDPSKMDFYDYASGDIVGTRSIAGDNSATFQGLAIDLKGQAQAGDTFRVLVSKSNAGDANNLKNMLAASLNNESTGVGGYSEIFGDLVSKTGMQIKENDQMLQTAEVLFQDAQERKSEFSGVDLDTEAARLMEQQQAYQALARVLTTARELLDTLLRSM
ncbi:MAG: flagellar hook-associated protein FlgK, partial [Planktomarina sp.]|nr:flagellar hook-associated protein FlgK [Planktomarina sp.]